jgi:hypothetical protein
MTIYNAPNTYIDDEVKIWNILIYNDFHAFCKGNWEIINNDFEEKEFYAIQGSKTNNKLDWNLQYYSLAAYKKDWLQQSQDFLKLDFLCDPLKVLFESTKLSKIKIQGDLALVHKEFNGTFELKGSDPIVLDWISLFTLRKYDSDWKIISFVGYLPKQ